MLGHREAEKVSWETKKYQLKKLEETQERVVSRDAMQSQNPQRQVSEIHPD